MKKILIIGYSSLVRRRIIPSLNIKKINYEIASRSNIQKDFGAKKWYNGYAEALDKSKAKIAYISLPNAYHYFWASKSLQNGFHTIIDKPATINSSQLRKLILLSKIKKKLLSESIFFHYHKQMKFIMNKRYLNQFNKIHMSFAIPKPHKKSILLSDKLKGGVIMDMGPYVAAITRIFFKNIPEKIIKKIVLKKKISTNCLFKFKFKKKYLIGIISHNDKYKNFIRVYFNDKVIKLSRVFSPPIFEEVKVLINKKNKKSIKKFTDDAFGNFISKIFQLIKKKNYYHFHNQMNFDMKIRNIIRSK